MKNLTGDLVVGSIDERLMSDSYFCTTLATIPGTVIPASFFPRYNSDASLFVTMS